MALPHSPWLAYTWLSKIWASTLSTAFLSTASAFALRLGGIFLAREVEFAQLQLGIYVLGIQLHASIQSAKGRA